MDKPIKIKMHMTKKTFKIVVAVAITCILAFGAVLAWSDEHEVILYVDGIEVDIPANKRLVIVPAHWKDDEIYRESHRADSVMTLLPEPPPNCADMEGELVLGGAICIP